MPEANRHPFLSAARLYDATVKGHYARRRCVVVPEAVPREMCATVLRSLDGTKFILNDEPERTEVTRFYTKNGDQLIAAAPELVEIERGLLEWINAIAGKTYVELDNRAIGFALNVTPPGGGFGSHFDRHEITIVLFLNDLDSGELNVYPAFPTLVRFASWLPGRYARRLLERALLLLNPTRIRPRAGTVVAFTKGSQHRVDPVKPGSQRVSFVLGFDKPGVSFIEGQKYYGFAQEDVTLNDLGRLAVG